MLQKVALELKITLLFFLNELDKLVIVYSHEVNILRMRSCVSPVLFFNCWTVCANGSLFFEEYIFQLCDKLKHLHW